jgi:hypothetical protein
MSRHRQPRAHAASAARAVTPRHGWLTFVGTMILVAGGFNLINGIAAVAGDDRYELRKLLFGDLELWGWVMIVFGAVQVVTALSVFTAQGWALTAGLILAVLNILWQIMFLGAYPLWSLSIMVVDALVIYGITVYGVANDV